MTSRSCTADTFKILTECLGIPLVYRVSLEYRPSLRNAHKRIMVEVPLYKGISTICSCGGRTRTCDLQVMSLASYQLLHSAILTIAIRLTIEVFLNCECKGMTFC